MNESNTAKMVFQIPDFMPALPEIFLLSMLLEQHKEVMRLRRIVGKLQGDFPEL